MMGHIGNVGRRTSSRSSSGIWGVQKESKFFGSWCVKVANWWTAAFRIRPKRWLNCKFCGAWTTTSRPQIHRRRTGADDWGLDLEVFLRTRRIRQRENANWHEEEECRWIDRDWIAFTDSETMHTWRKNSFETRRVQSCPWSVMDPITKETWSSLYKIIFYQHKLKIQKMIPTRNTDVGSVGDALKGQRTSWLWIQCSVRELSRGSRRFMTEGHRELRQIRIWSGSPRIILTM